MTEHHPITPPPELVQQWADDINNSNVHYDDQVGHYAYEQHIATRAAQWSADQELEACCEWMQNQELRNLAGKLRAERRPKPPSLKEQAMALLQPGQTCLFNSEMQDIIRRALEALPND